MPSIYITITIDCMNDFLAIDSWGKLPEGILSGHVNSFGDFDECVGVKIDDLQIRNEIYPELNDKAEKHFAGQYCTSYILDYESAMYNTPVPVGLLSDVETRHEVQQETLSLLEFLVKLQPAFKFKFKIFAVISIKCSKLNLPLERHPLTKAKFHNGSTNNQHVLSKLLLSGRRSTTAC